MVSLARNNIQQLGDKNEWKTMEDDKEEDTFAKEVEMLENPYGTKNLLGSGMYAATYKEVPGNPAKNNHKVVAVKKFFHNDDFNLRTLHNERTILEKLRGHEHIVTFYFHSNVFLYMEFLGEQNLRTWWEHNTYYAPSRDTVGIEVEWMNQTLLHILRGLCSALVFLKENGIVHFDIKSDNIMLRNNDPACPVLIDFGRSYEMAGAIVHDQYWGEDGPPCGAYCCQPPEILNIIYRHARRRPPASITFNNTVDVYCTGVLMFNLFCDEYPNGFFVSETKCIVPLLEKISKRDWASNKTFANNMELCRIVTPMLSENYLQRPDAQDVLVQVELLLAAKKTAVC